MFRKIILALIFVMVLSSICIDSYACGKHEKGKPELIKKFYCILKAKDELKLSSVQLEKIENEIINAKKEVIMTKAKIEIAAMDIKIALKQDKIDEKSINKLIDQKYELKKNMMKTLIKAYVNIKDLLSKDQKAMLPEIYKYKKAKECDYKKEKGDNGQCYIDDSGKQVCPVK